MKNGGKSVAFIFLFSVYILGLSIDYFFLIVINRMIVMS